ncbi:hypothetical protein BC828DRAFT_399016 [Blastocladiella britannica]|nr:hypothetical protein BC828DRAFT_399016 [Blastocladiella britannica]
MYKTIDRVLDVWVPVLPALGVPSLQASSEPEPDGPGPCVHLGDPSDPRTFYVKRAPADHPEPDYLPMIMGFARADMTTNSLLDLMQRFGTQAKTINDPPPSVPRPNTASADTAAPTRSSDATARAEATKHFGTVFKEHCHEDAIDLFVMMRSWLTVLAMTAAAVSVVENLFPQLCGNHTAAELPRSAPRRRTRAQTHVRSWSCSRYFPQW